MAFGASMGMKAGGAFVKLAVQTGQSGRRVDSLGRKVMTLKARFGALRRGFGDARMGLSSVVQGMRPAIFAGVAASALGLREALSFDQEIANLTSVTGDLGDQAPAIKRGIKALALDPKNAATAQEAAQAYTMMARSGVDASERLGAASVALQLASLDIKLSSDDAAIFATKTARQFGLGYEEIGNKLARAADAIPGNVSDITTAMQYAGPAALQMGLDMDSALSMVMSAVTRMRASRAGTAIGQFLTALAKPAKLKVLDKIMKGAGMERIFNPDTGKMRNMGSILGDINTVFANMSDKKRAEAMFKVFGIRGTRAVTMFMKAAEAAGQSYGDMMNKVKSGITLSEKAQNRAQGMMAQLKHIRTSLGVIAIDFFGALFGAGGGMGNAAETIANVAKAFGALVDNSAEAQVGAMGLSEGVWAAARGIKDAVEGVKSAFAWLGGAISWVAGLFGLEGTQQVTKFLITFMAVSPVIMIVGMGLMMLTSIARGLFLIFSGGARIVWTLIGAYKGAVIWSWKLLFANRAQLGAAAANSAVLMRLGDAWRFVRQKMWIASSQFSIAQSKMGTLKATALMAGRGIVGLGKGLAAIVGPAGIAFAAMEGLAALFGAFTDEVEQTKEELGRPTEINLVSERAGTMEKLAKELGDKMMLQTYAPKGPLKFFGGARAGMPGGREEVRLLFQKLLEVGKAARTGEFAEGKLEALGLSAKQSEQLIAKHGIGIGDEMNDIGLKMTALRGTFEEYEKSLEAEKVARKGTPNELEAAKKRTSAAFRSYEDALSNFISSTEGASEILKAIFAAMEAASGERVAALAGVAGAEAEANAAAASKKMKNCIDNNIKLNVGGRELASVVSRAQLDINERGGASVHPWQRHIVTQDGAEPVSGMA